MKPAVLPISHPYADITAASVRRQRGLFSSIVILRDHPKVCHQLKQSMAHGCTFPPQCLCTGCSSSLAPSFYPDNRGLFSFIKSLQMVVRFHTQRFFLIPSLIHCSLPGLQSRAGRVCLVHHYNLPGDTAARQLPAHGNPELGAEEMHLGGIFKAHGAEQVFNGAWGQSSAPSAATGRSVLIM